MNAEIPRQVGGWEAEGEQQPPGELLTAASPKGRAGNPHLQSSKVSSRSQRKGLSLRQVFGGFLAVGRGLWSPDGAQP